MCAVGDFEKAKEMLMKAEGRINFEFLFFSCAICFFLDLCRATLVEDEVPEDEIDEEICCIR